MTQEHRVLTLEEVADFLRVRKQTVRDYLKKGEIKGFQVGSHWRIRQGDLDQFIENNMNTSSNGDIEENSREGIPITRLENYQPDQDYTNTKIVKFQLEDKVYQASTWKELLKKMTEVMAQKTGDDFEKVLGFKGRTKWRFSRNKTELRRPELVKGTDIYVETNLNAKSIVQVCIAMLEMFGYDKEDLDIEIED